MATELKPCPFCGGEAKINYVLPFVHPRNGRKGLERWQVFCDRCGVVTPGMLSKEEAMETWNRRAAHVAIPTVLELEGKEVVRCKDCIHFDKEKALRPGGIWCGYWGTDPDPEDFCCKGERKDDA